MVAPYSGAMLATVARSESEISDNPSPKNSTKLSTTPWARSRSVMVSTRSVAVTPSCKAPLRRKPTTFGVMR